MSEPKKWKNFTSLTPLGPLPTMNHLPGKYHHKEINSCLSCVSTLLQDTLSPWPTLYPKITFDENSLGDI